MKLLLAFAALALFPRLAEAMVYGDSHILSRAEMQDRGVEISIRDGPKPGRGIVVSVSAVRTGGPPRFESMSCVVLTQVIDADLAIADAKNRGFVVPKKWGREERSESSRKLVWTFSLSESEVLRSYLLVRMNLPPKEGIPVFGTYYFLFRDFRQPANPLPVPVPAAPPAGSETSHS